MATTVFACVVAVALSSGDEATQFLSGRSHEAPEVSPKLDPESHKVFYKMDYPHDEQPPTDKPHEKSDFTHPYPVIQENEAYDKDYVKDENNDGGEWKAQMEYDTLRHKILKVRQGVDQKKEFMKQAEQEVQVAQDAHEASAESVKKAQNKTQEAKAEAEEAAKKVDELEGRKYHRGEHPKIGGKLGPAIDKVKEEMDNFEKCQEQLEKARSKLETLVEEHEAAMRAKAEAAANMGEGGAEGLDESLEARVVREEEEDEDAHKSLEEREKELADAQSELDKAAEKLRKFRHEQAVGPGVTVKDGAASLFLSSTALFAVLAAGIAL